MRYRRRVAKPAIRRAIPRGVNVDTVIINVSGYADGAGAGRAAADAFRRQLGLQRRLPFGTA